MDKFNLEKIIQIMNDKNVCYYDDEINTPAMKTIKAIIPYIDLETQKQIGIMIKFMEIKMLLDVYEKKSDPIKTDLQSAFFNAMKIHAGKDNLSVLSKILQMQNILSNQKNEKDDENMDDVLKDDAFENLSDENKKLLNDFLRDISGKSSMEAVNIMMEYNKKMPQNILPQQKTAMINVLLKKMPPQKQQQFLAIYNMFGNK